jgi:primosomal protein N''
MLVFDEFVLSGQRNCCNLWAREPKFNRVCFSIDTNLLSNVLKEAHIDLAELELCERERPQIEAACRRAFANRACREIELQPDDFEQVYDSPTSSASAPEPVLR